MSNTKNILEYDLKHNICYVILKSCNPDVDIDDEAAEGCLAGRPMTTCKTQNDLFQVGDLTTAEPGNISMWDIFAGEEKHVATEDVVQWTMQTTPVPQDKVELKDGNLVVVDEADLTGIKQLKGLGSEMHDWPAALNRLSGEMQELTACKGLADDDKLQRIMMRNDCDQSAWAVLKTVGFGCECVDELIHADEDTMSDIRDGYMNTIREHRKTSFEELDQLEQEARDTGASDDDLKDIDTIKQMFRDIPQDTDLSGYKNALELLEFWPSLILPSPVNYTLKSYVKARMETEHPLKKFIDGLDVSHVDQIKDILKLTEQQKLNKEELIARLKQESIERGETFVAPEESYIAQANDMMSKHDTVVEMLTNKLKELT